MSNLVEIIEKEDSVISAYPHHKQVQPGFSFVLSVQDSTVYVPVYSESKEVTTLHAGTILVQYELIECDQVDQEEGYSMVQKIMEAIGPENYQVKGKLSGRASWKNKIGHT